MTKSIIRSMYLLIAFYYHIKNIILRNSCFGFLRRSFHYSYLKYCGVESEFGAVTLVGLPLIKKNKNSKIILGRGVTLVSKSYGNVAGINHPVILATLSEGAVIKLGNGVGVSGSSICAVKSVIIGNNSGLGANSHVYDTDFHEINSFALKNENILSTGTKPVIIGENVWIGTNVLVLKGVTIGNEAVIGARSVVRKDVSPNTLAIGNPAEAIRLIKPER